MKKITAAVFLLCAILITSCAINEVPEPVGEVTDRIDSPWSTKESVTDPEETGIPGTSPADETTATPVEEPETVISFLGVGDNIIYYGNVRDAQSQAEGSGYEYNFLPAYSEVADRIAAADIAFINQETLMSGDAFEYYPHFNGPQDAGRTLTDLGFDVVNMSNNHMADHGPDGLKKTIDFWHTQDVTMIGGYYDLQDFDNIRVTETKGVKIAWLSYTYGTNGLSLPSSSPLKIPYINESDIRKQVDSAKKLGDLVFVSVHWGEENYFKPTSEQIYYGQLMADLGVDVILGHHPHVIQPVEWLTGSGGNKTLCIYSLGNFMAEMARDYNMVGGIVTFDIVRKGEAKPTIENILFTPTMFHFPRNFYNNKIYLLEDYSEELASAHGVITYYKNTMSYNKLISYVKNTISAEFLPEFYY